MKQFRIQRIFRKPGYLPHVVAFSIVMMFLITVLLSGFTATADTPVPHSVLLISMDGFRWDYPEKANTPNLDWLIEHGVRAKSLKSIFPSKTFPNHYTIVTGLYAEHHGIVANNMYDPNMDTYFSLSNRKAVTDGRWYGGEPVWVTAEKQGLVTATFSWPGSEAEIEGLRPTFWKVYDGRIPNSERVSQILRWLDLPEAKRPRFLTLYFSDTDNMGHRYGPDSPEVVEAIESLDFTLGQLIAGLKARELMNRVNLIIVSDHGMTSISPDRVIFVDDYISLKDTDVIDWSPILALRPKKGKLEKIYQALKNAHPHLKVYKKSEIPERYHYRDNPRIMPIIGVADEGWSITSRNYFETHQDHYSGGTHGYDPALKSMQGIFIASGPDFKSGLEVNTFQNIHIYNAICSILNLQPAPNDGNPDSINVMLKQTH